MALHLVTGASGFLGRALVELLVSEGHRVRAFDLALPGGRGGEHPQVRLEPDLPRGAEFVRGDIRDARAVEEACRGADAVHHLVALLPQKRAPRPLMQAVNVGGTRNVLEGAKRQKARRVVFLSSTEVYGRPRTLPCPEDAEPWPLGEYGRNKVEAEALCRDYGRDGLEVVVLRPPTIVGPRIPDRMLLRMMELLRTGGTYPLPGSGANRVALLSARDCARACLVASESPRAPEGVFNIAAEERPPTVRELAEALIAHAGTRIRMFSVPPSLVLGGLEFLHILGLSPLEREHYLLLHRDYYFGLRRSREMLGWKAQQSTREAMVEMFEWYRATRPGAKTPPTS